MSAPADGRTEPGLAATLALYALARLALIAVIAGLLLLAGTPLVVALLVALVVALPLSMLVFRGLRARLDAAFAASRARRSQERDALRAGLRGDDPTPDTLTEDASEPPGRAGFRDALSGDGAERQPDATRD